MTLIASFSVGDCSCMLGDLLLSGPEREDISLHVPSIGDVTRIFPKGSGFVPVSLTRKVCQFGNLSVAWAGGYLAARLIIKHLFEIVQRAGPIDPKHFAKLLEDLPHVDPWVERALDKHEVALLAHLVGPNDGKTYFFGLNCAEFDSAAFGRVRLAGSGSSFFRTYFDHTNKPVLELPIANGIEATLCGALTCDWRQLHLPFDDNYTYRVIASPRIKLSPAIASRKIKLLR